MTTRHQRRKAARKRREAQAERLVERQAGIVADMHREKVRRNLKRPLPERTPNGLVSCVYNGNGGTASRALGQGVGYGHKSEY